MYEEFTSILGHICKISIDEDDFRKMISEREEWLVYVSYLEDIKIMKWSFQNSEIIHIPRTHSLIVDNLTCKSRKHL